ncbi:MAG TPA: carboxypeptidase-like regulatory domain-containing protein, partial [Planctomycetaceae bacterium]|nr:carboxypeptidase-like regulatory domain-containing protein [Planctomycetaceae bacterium]
MTRPPIEEALNIAPWVAQLTRLPLQDAYLVGVGEVAVNTLVAMLWQRADVRGEIATDADGRVRMCVFPGRTYEMSYERPRLAQTDRHNPVQVIHVPNGVDKIDLEPIEVVQPCTINGRIENASGKPIPGLRIRGICGTDGGRPNHGDGVSRWTTSDSAGQFRFDNVAAGTKATLVPVRAGVPLADPIEITADDKPVRLREKTCESVALGGRIIGVDHKPIAGAQIAIEVTHSPDPLSSFAMRTDADGTFRTPAQFPKPLAYRLVVRTILVDVASSVWLCPAASGNQFPDVVVERSKLRLDSKLSGNEIVAVLNGEPIQASLALERAFCAPLRPDRMTLWYATKRLTAGKMSEHEYRELQETGIRQHLGEQIRTRLLAEARLSTCNRAEREVTENAIASYWKEYLETVRKQQNASNDDELERKLAGLGTSLAGLHREFRYHHLASWYRKRAGRSETKIDWRHSLAWYQAHRRSYAEKEQVRWQLLEIEFEHPTTPTSKSRAVAAVGNASTWDRSEATHAEGSTNTQTSNAWFADDFGKSTHNSYQVVQDTEKAQISQLDSQSATPGFEAQSPTSNADVEKSDTTPKKDGADFDVVAYAERLPLRLNLGQARGLMDQALSHLRKGEQFDAVAKKFSNGPHADRG